MRLTRRLLFRGPGSNPSRGSVTIGYMLATESPAPIRVYDVAGRLVKTLVSGTGEAGPHEVVWDATSDHGRRVGAGVYFYKMTAGSWQSQRKVVFLEP
jgi:flagellar hook assembly protein FlgD